MNDVARQLCGEIRELVSIQILGGRQDLVIVHVGDQRLAHRIGDLEQDVAIALGLDQLPDGQAIVQRERLENMRDVRRVQHL